VSFKSGFFIGAAVGYVLGARAGRERYQQISDLWASFTGSESVQTVAEKGRAVVDLASDRVRDAVGSRLHDASEEPGEAAEEPGDA
jgi:hypothetical protein